MSDLASLAHALASNPRDWNRRIEYAEALIDAGYYRAANELVATESTAPISMAVSHRINALLAKIPSDYPLDDPAGPEVDLSFIKSIPVPEVKVLQSEPVAVRVWEEAGDEEGHHGRHFIVGGEVDPDLLKPFAKQKDSAQKVSALTLALLVHVAIILALSVWGIAVTRQSPPQIVAQVSPNVDETTLDETKVQQISRSKPTSSSAMPTMAISAVSASPVVIPEFEQNAVVDVTVGFTGTSIGTGMSFSGEGEASEVNFFGIKSKGTRLAFVIDAEDYMLEDKKGGMPAYDKVKEEIARMLAGLNRHTAFNVLIYQGKRLATFRTELVPASPSNVRLATEWLKPLNTDYNALGIRGGEYNTVDVRSGIEPINSSDISGYPKALQAAMEMDVHTIFVVASGWRHMSKSYTQEEREQFARKRDWDDKRQAAWEAAVKKARDWLKKENEARKQKGIAPKVVANWSAFTRELSPGVPGPPGLRGYNTEEVEEQIQNVVSEYYRKMSKPRPEVNIVVFVGEDEKTISQEEHFENLAKRNRGKLKILKGLAELKNVTGG